MVSNYYHVIALQVLLACTLYGTQFVSPDQYKESILVLKLQTKLTIKEMHHLEHSYNINALAFSPNDKYLAVGDDKGAVLWDPSKGNKEKTFDTYKSVVSQVFFTPDGEKLVGIYREFGGGTTKMWDIASGREIFSKPKTGIFGILPNGKEFVSHAEGIARFHDVKTFDVIRQFRILPTAVGIDWVALSPDGKMIANGSSIDKTIKTWSVDFGGEFATLKGHKVILRGLSFSKTGKWVAAIGGDNAVRLWNSKTGELIYTVTLEGRPTSMALSADEKWLAVGIATPPNHKLAIYEAAKGMEAFAVGLKSGAIRAIEFDSKTNVIACASGKTVQLFTFTTDTEKKPMKSK